MELRDITINQRERAAELLSNTLANDRGMRALFAQNDPKYKQKLYIWFNSTLKRHIQNNQILWGIYQQNELAGLAMINHSSFKPSGYSLIQWTLSILFSCGFRTVFRTIKHDQTRRKHFTQNHQYILEFIAVDPTYQGQGIGRTFLDKLQEHARRQNKNIWLETTKAANVKIFEKAGYQLIHRKVEFDVEYYIMVNNRYQGTRQKSNYLLLT